MTWIADRRFARVPPKLKPGTRLDALPLSPEEGFVLSRVDGVSTVEEICLIAGLPPERTLSVLAKLHQVGVLEVPGAPAQAAAEPTNAVTPAVQAKTITTTTPTPAALQEAAPEGGGSSTVPPFAPDPVCELSEDKQIEIHQLYYRLDELDFYTLLGLQPGCDGRDVQRAYRKISLKYHPDRFYGKSLGTFKERLDTIFRHASNVADYLTDDEQRAAYEAELPSAGAAPEEAATTPMAAPISDARGSSGASTSAHGGPEEPTTAELEALGRPRNLTREQRLRRLGGVLGMSTQELKTVARGRQTPPAEVPDLSKERKARLREQSRGAVRKSLSPVMQRLQKAREHYDEGVKAMLAGSWATAASNLKLATTFDPKNQEYREKEQVASQRARALAAESYMKRAAFEESVGHNEEAARLYSMAADRHESIDYLTRAAAALARTGELKRAMEYAIKAKDLNPNSVPARISLANAYLAAGMPKNARREVDYVLKLDSDNPAAKTLLKEIRRAE